MPKKRKHYYWNKDTEQAIVDYINTDDTELRSRIFKEHLYSPFWKMSEIMIRRFRFFKQNTILPRYDISNTIKDVISFVSTKIEMFDPSKGFKAFSYFSLIIKNYLMQQNMKESNYNLKNIQMNDWMGATSSVRDFMGYNSKDRNPNHVNLYKEILNEMSVELKKQKVKVKKLEHLKVMDTLLDLFENPHGWGDKGKDNKKSIFKKTRELNNVTTRDITYVLTLLRKKYPKIKERVMSEIIKINRKQKQDG